jgi:nucleotide-binding universal stress UspA family protein
MQVSTSTGIREKAPLPEFVVRQLIAGIELGRTDESLLRYIHYFAGIVPVEAAFFLHVVPEFSLFAPFLPTDIRPLAGEYLLSETIINQIGTKVSVSMPNTSIRNISYDVREGNPLAQMLEEVKERNADLVVIGQKANTSSHGIMANSMARKVDCNALVVPDCVHPAIQKILVPVDFSPHSGKALQTAIALNKHLAEPAEIIVVNAYEMPDLSVYKIHQSEESFQKMVEEDRMLAFDAFLINYATEGDKHIRQELLLQESPGTAQHLLDFAKTVHADFIVMGAKGHSTVELLLLGSVTERVLSANTMLPILIVK